jgi:hypothetical protein
MFVPPACTGRRSARTMRPVASMSSQALIYDIWGETIDQSTTDSEAGYLEPDQDALIASSLALPAPHGG